MRSWRPTAVSVALRPEKEPATLSDLGARVQRAQATIPFVLDGQVLAENLTICGKDAAWLERTAQANSLLLEEIPILAGNDTEDYFLLKKEPRQTAGSGKGCSMKRIYVCIGIVVLLLAAAFTAASGYSNCRGYLR